jgi:hypothetical protein
MVQNLAPIMNAPKLLDPKEWREWAMSVTSNPSIRKFQPPDPNFFEDWQDWAERFVQVVSL